MIFWLEEEGKFNLSNPNVEAQRVMVKKNSPHINEEKLSRTIRYQYDRDIIFKVHAKRFIYKFMCELRQFGWEAEGRMLDRFIVSLYSSLGD